MTRTTDISTPYDVPPTCNDLRSSQRTRLVRSTRKLGDVLGTTPHLLEYTGGPRAAVKKQRGTLPRLTLADHHQLATKRSHSKLHSAKKNGKRQLKIFPKSAADHASSISSFESFQSGPDMSRAPVAQSTPAAVPESKLGNMSLLGPRARVKPSLARLNLHAVPRALSMFDSPDFMISPTETALSTPATSTFTITNTIHIDTSNNVANVIARRRKMAKLKRTLGENVPTELVFPRHNSAPVSPSFQPLRRSVDTPAYQSIDSPLTPARKSSLKRIKSSAFQHCHVLSGPESSKPVTTPDIEKAALHFNKHSRKRVSDLSLYSIQPEIKTAPVSNEEYHGIIPARRSGVDLFDMYSPSHISHAKSASVPVTTTSPLHTAKRVSSKLFASRRSAGATGGSSNNSSDSGHTASGGGMHYRKSVHVALEAQNPAYRQPESRWEGTWNRNDMDEVRQGLRALRI